MNAWTQPALCQQSGGSAMGNVVHTGDWLIAVWFLYKKNLNQILDTLNITIHSLSILFIRLRVARKLEPISDDFKWTAGYALHRSPI